MSLTITRSARPLAPAASTAAAAAHHAQFHTLRALALRGACWAVADAVLAVLLVVVRGDTFRHSIAYSESIGLSCWLLVDGGHIALTRLLARVRGIEIGDEPLLPWLDRGWMGWGWMLLALAIGCPLGYLIGARLGDLFIGAPAPMLSDVRGKDAAMSAAITVTMALVGVYFFYSRVRLAALRIEAEAARRIAAENELRLLQAQLEPHMLFNTLANLRALITLDPPQAQRMLDRLIAFLRATLGASRATTHTLAAEFNRIEDYLALMAVRMGARLSSVVELPAALADFVVPSLLLQPLVENAIRHGLEPKVGGGRIEVRARRAADRVLLEVSDTGVGLSPAATRRDAGIGVRLVRERLAVLYGGDATLTLEPAATGEDGTIARIDVPSAPPPAFARAAPEPA
ncbi:MAG TPA: histidine kinase [Burkholderiaceae bacterium]|nr:histidine kinase [Burkholderiaceae bacterium]